MLHSEEANKKRAKEKRHKPADESPNLQFAQMTKAEKMKKGLCSKCGKCGHKANQCKAKDETGAADGFQAVQIDNQEQVHSQMSN